MLTQTGYAGQTVTLDVEDGGRIVGSQPVRLPADGDPVSVRVKFTATEAGPRVFRLKVAPQPGEVVTQNNQRDVQIDIRDRKERILYYEGEPRFEMKFARQAIKDDQEPRARHAAAHRREQAPPARRRRRGRRARRGVLRRRARICSPTAGSCSAASRRARSTPTSSGMISEFVDVRGGGLLLLGGARAFARRGLRRHAARRDHARRHGVAAAACSRT